MNSVGPAPGSDRALAYLLLRVTLGINILIHGLSRILAGPAVFAGTLDNMFRQTPLPTWQVHAFGLVLPWLEGALGLLLLLGVRTRMALVGGALLIVVLTFGTTLRQDWESAGLQMIYAGVYAALLAFRNWDRFSMDAYFDKVREKN